MQNNNFGQRRLAVVPGWIYRAALRNNVNVMDLAEYGKIRTLISRDDLSQWYHINGSLRVGSHAVSTGSLQDIFRKLTPEERYELERSVIPCAGMQETAQAAQARLTNQNGVEGVAYCFISNAENTYIVVYEGFLTFINDPVNKLKFVQDYLKELSKFDEIHRVSECPLFELYLQLFKADADYSR